MEKSKELMLEMRGIDKKFPGVHALKNVDFMLRRGEIHGLLGENGAGKSTLMKVLGGVESLDVGEIYIDGQKADISAPLDAQKLGVSFIHQELSLFLDLDIATNIYIQDLPKSANIINEKLLRKNAQALLNKVGLGNHKATELVKDLQLGERQLVEIARCLMMDTKVLVLDEPTSSLTKNEVETLFGLMRQLKSKGISIIFISHRLDEVFDVCDRATIMRDGQIIETKIVEDCKTSDIVKLMIGRELDDMFNRPYATPKKEILRIENFNRGEKFKDINFNLYEGEIVGLYGLMGSGRSEIVRSIFGLERYDSGEVYIEGEKVNIRCPQDAMQHGIGLITENRREEGLMLQQSVQFNIVSSNLPAYKRNVFGFMNHKKELSAARDSVSAFSIKTSGLEKETQFLSGGNQQKVVIAKWINRGPKILILDEPTRGVDVGAKFEIYKILSDQVQDGNGVFVISSELNEIMGLCDRILVIRKGQIVEEFSHEQFSKEALLKACMGGKQNDTTNEESVQ